MFFAAVIGIRRVGKTYLIRTFFEDQIDFEMVGLRDGNMEQQLRNFAYSFKEAKRQKDPIEKFPKDWLEAFHDLMEHLESLEKRKKRKVVFIDEICFHPQGSLRSEFDNLYSSLFSNPERYEIIVSALASTWKGLSRTEILSTAKLKDGGGITTVLRELEQSGFISSYVPFNKKKKDTLYRLTDNYSLFYLKYIRDLPKNEAGNWLSLSQTQSWKSWSGYAYENICFQHIDKIKVALGISGVHTRHFSFIVKATDQHEGAQVDLLIDRKDSAISICEVKFYNDEYALTKEEADKIRRKRRVFRQVPRTQKQIFIVLITTFGLADNKYSLELIDNKINMDKLF